MELTDVLRGGRQCDEDGVEIIMSREACHVAADEIERLQELVRWAYSKLHGRTFNDIDDALKLDEMKLLLEHGA